VKGCSAEATASWLELFAESNERRDATEQGVPVVSAAPAGDIAMHRDTAVVAQDLSRRATQSLLISTCGIFGGREIFRSLAARMASNTELRVRLFLNIAGDVVPADPHPRLIYLSSSFGNFVFTLPSSFPLFANFLGTRTSKPH
jgi:hypothetical protein